MNPEKHVTILGVLHIAFGVVFLLVGLAAVVVLSGIGAVSGDETAFGILGLIGTAGFLFFLVLVIGCLRLIEIPIGTALVIYTVRVSMDNETGKLFRAGTPAAPNQASAPA